MSKSSKKRNSKRVYKNFTILALFFVIFGGMYYYLNVYMEDSDFNADGANQHIPEYIVLENTDSVKYAAIVMYSNNVNINNIASTFYKSNIFWPYIFIENQHIEEVKANPLDIPKGIVLKIPRMPQSMIDLGNQQTLDKVKMLTDSILSNAVIQ